MKNLRANSIVPTNINYNSKILDDNIKSLKSIYPFLSIFSSGKSVMGKNIPVIKIGNGLKEVFYSGAIHRKRMDYIYFTHEIHRRLLLCLC